jgi:hypothetical protein
LDVAQYELERYEHLSPLIKQQTVESIASELKKSPSEGLSFQTEKPGDSKGRRLRRLLDATCTAFAATSDIQDRQVARTQFLQPNAAPGSD